MDDSRFTPDKAAYWVSEYKRAQEEFGDTYSAREFVASLRRCNVDESVCQFALKALL